MAKLEADLAAAQKRLASLRAQVADEQAKAKTAQETLATNQAATREQVCNFLSFLWTITAFAQHAHTHTHTQQTGLLAAVQQSKAVADAALDRVLHHYAQSVASVHAGLQLGGAKVSVVAVDVSTATCRTDPDLDPAVEWPLHCAAVDASLAAAVAATHAARQAVETKMAAADRTHAQSRAASESAHEAALAQLKDVLARKDAALAGFDEQLQKLNAAAARAAAAEATTTTLRSEIEALERKVGEQRGKLADLAMSLQEERVLRDTMARHADFRRSVLDATSNASATPAQVVAAAVEAGTPSKSLAPRPPSTPRLQPKPPATPRA
jgi:chromosome segregation ATPase